MTAIIPMVALFSTISFVFYRWKTKNDRRARTGAVTNQKSYFSWFKKATKSIKEEVDYATPEYNQVYPITITSMLVFALLGVLCGQLLKSYIFSLVLMLVFSVIPWLFLRFVSNRKLRKLESELPTFVTDLVHHLRIEKDMSSALKSCNNIHVIEKEQEKMRSNLSGNVTPEEALKVLYNQTRSRWFLLIGQMASVMNRKRNIDAVISQFMKMQIDIQKANARKLKSQERTVKKAWMLLFIEGIFFGTVMLAVQMIQDPYLYFTETEKGRFQLFIGFFFAIMPILYLLYLLLRRR